ncbi:hypothetical protein V8G54_035010 [Vigna mungo]|uniref:Integrase catalytic domain-containing protein n=1 Tax=Vigna mungo TaxID=3915 RepID=A0AAQ3ME82_VIGMU
MQSYLEGLDLWEAVEEDYSVQPLLENPTLAQIKNHKEQKTKKAKAKSSLFSGVTTLIFTRTMTLKSPKKIWDFLKEEYEGDDRIKSMQVLILRREFEMQRMNESETIKEYSNTLLGIANKIKLLGSDFADSRIVRENPCDSAKNVRSVYCLIGEYKESVQDYFGRGVTRFASPRTLMSEDRVVEGALRVKHHEVRTNKKKIFKRFQPASSENGVFNQKQAVICKANVQQEAEGDAQNAQENEDQLFATACFSSSNSNESWLIDSGCTNHMTYDKELFKCLDMTEVKWVRIGNGEQLPVKGKGSIAITTHIGTKTLSDVLYVPKINQNLLSVGPLLEKGFKVIFEDKVFEDKVCTIKDPTGLEMFKVKMRSKSFSFNPMKEKQIAFPVTASSVKLWHKRLVHFHHLGMNYMLKNQLVCGVPSLTEKPAECEACRFGKQTRKPFPKSSWRASKKLQLVHTDVAGPQRTPSIKGKVAAVFWKFKAFVENQSNCHIQILRSDNGKEYIANQFQQFCDEVGIEHQLTAPYTLRQNGVSERKNRSIVEMARCMLHQKELPKKFWAEATNIAVFIQNRLPTRALQNQTPFQAWFGFKPSLYFLKVFGCLFYSHIPQIKRDKLDKRAAAGLFIGYNTISKAYRIFQPQTGKILINENWCWSDLKKSQNTELEVEDTVDDPPVRGTRLLFDIYQKSNVSLCNIAICEPSSFEEAAKEEKWLAAMPRSCP